MIHLLLQLLLALALTKQSTAAAVAPEVEGRIESIDVGTQERTEIIAVTSTQRAPSSISGELENRIRGSSVEAPLGTEPYRGVTPGKHRRNRGPPTIGASDALPAPGGMVNGVPEGAFTDVAARIDALADLQRVRGQLGPLPAGRGKTLQPDGGTLASLSIDGSPRVYGANSVAERTLFGSATRFEGTALRLFEGPPAHPTLVHAEGAAFERARRAGLSGKRGVLTVDKNFCSWCEWGVDELGRSLGLEELEIIIPGRAPEIRRF